MVLRKPVPASSQAGASSHRDCAQPHYRGLTWIRDSVRLGQDRVVQNHRISHRAPGQTSIMWLCGATVGAGDSLR